MTEEILKIYNKYDCGDIEDKDAARKIVELFLNQHTDKKNLIDELYKKYNSGNIDSGDFLMRVMNIIEETYPNLYE